MNGRQVEGLRRRREGGIILHKYVKLVWETVTACPPDLADGAAFDGPIYRGNPGPHPGRVGRRPGLYPATRAPGDPAASAIRGDGRRSAAPLERPAPATANAPR